MSQKSLYIVDGHSLLFKAFFAIRRLNAPDGAPVNAVFGFAQMINKIVKDFLPEHLCVCFDLPGPTFRNEIYPEYKANRPPAPEDLNLQTPVAKEFVDARGIRRLELENFESDDLMATLATRAAAEGYRVYIVTADKDLLQLVNDSISVLKPEKSGFERLGPDEVTQRMGAPPALMTDFQGLTGDSSDNIPGVPGIGPKTAAKLLEGRASLEDLLDHVDEVSNKRQRGLLTEHADQARLSKRLATLATDAPVAIEPAECAFDGKPTQELYAFYSRLGFARLRDEAAKALGVKPGDPSDGTKTSEGGRGEEDDLAEETPISSTVAAGELRPADTMTRLVWEEGELAGLAEELRRANLFAFDTETTSVDPLRAELVGLSLAWEEGAAVYIPVGHALTATPRAQVSLEAVQGALGPVLADPSVAKIAQNAKYDLHVLERHGMPVAGVRFDPMIASYLADPGRAHGLKAMAAERLGIAMTEISELIGTGRGQITMDQVEVERAAPYAAADADMTLRLRRPLAQELEAGNLTRMFEEIEMPLVPVLQRMEARGVRIDTAHFKQLARRIDERLEALKAQAIELAGRDFNPDSTQQLAAVLFEDLGLPSRKRGRTGYSTDVEVLEELAGMHELPKLMLEYRGRRKLKSTYVDALPKLVHPQTGRIHTSFNQTIAATGRLSSSDPNLQNIPVRTAEGREVRRGFVPSESGRVLCAADYSQIELRILAHVTQEPALLEAFAQDRDVHVLTASRVFDTPPEEVTEAMRAQAKTVNFGVIYGMSAARLSRQLGISMGKASKFIRDYFAAYPGVKQWTSRVVEEAAERGYVTTLAGRRRYLPNLASRSPQTRRNAERIAVNTPIQGTAADMIKIAMLRLEERLGAGEPDARMILQVHDELIFDVAEADADRLADLAREEMSQALPLSIPLKVDVKIGRNWAEC